MKHKALIAALLLSTSLVSPQKAAAAPIIAFIGGALNAAGAGTWLASSAVGAWSAGFAAGGFLTGTIAGRLLVSVGLSVLSQALAPRPNIPPPSARMVNYAQPITFAEWAVGRTRKGGPMGFSEAVEHVDVITGTGGKKRHYSPILAAHSIKGVVTHYLDEREVEIDDNGLVTTDPMAGYYRIRPFTGSQAADPELMAAFPEITAAHDFAGLSGAHIWARKPASSKFTEIYPNSRQGAYAPVIDGHDGIYDPRDGAHKWTRNAALVLAFWITEILGQQVDWDDVAIEADVCDELVMNRDGILQPRWQLDGTISDDSDFESQRAQLAAACDAFLYERPDGKVGFRVGRWIEPEITLTQADFFSMEMTQGAWGSDAPTEVAAIYVEPANQWRESPSGPFVISTTERTRRDTPQLLFASNHNQAWRMNVRLAKTKRPKYQIQGSIGLIGYYLQGQRFIRVNNSEMGVDEYFEIGELYRNQGGFTFNIVANSVDPADFSPDAMALEPPRPEYKQIVSENDVGLVTGLTAVAENGGGVRWSWAAQDESLTQQLRIRESGGFDWQITSVPEGQSLVVITGQIDGQTYEGQARNRTVAGRLSEWGPSVTVQVVKNSTPPTALTSFSASESAGDVGLLFGAPNDPNYHATRIYRATDSADFANAALVHTEYGVPSNSDSWTDTTAVVVPPASSTDYTYWAEPINPSGIEGPRSGPQTVTIT